MAPERKSVTVYGLEHAVSAARVAAEAGVPIHLISGDAAAAHAGPAWFRSLLEETRRQAPDADVEGALDCDDFTGYALAALREGLSTIIYDGTANDAVDDIARQCDATVLRSRSESLDARAAESAGSLEAALRAWFT